MTHARAPDSVPLNDLRLALPRSVVPLYAVAALAFSVGLLAMGRGRSGSEFSLWLLAWLGVGVASIWRPRIGPLLAGFMAFALGFVRTYEYGPNLDLGLSLILLALAAFLRCEPRGADRHESDPAGLLLLAISAWTLLSLAFAVARIRCFVPAPGFEYHVYRFSSFGLSSEDVIRRALLNAAATFSWFGAYRYACAIGELRRRPLALAVLAALLVNSAALVVEMSFRPAFLHPAAWPSFDRFNGVTSFCYALGDVALALFLLLPAWACARGVFAAITGLNLLLILHGVVASGSRTALGTMLAVTVLWAASRAARLGRSGRGRAAAGLATAAALLLAAAAIGYWLTPGNQSTPLGRLKDGVQRQGWMGHFFATRLNSYPLAFRLLREYPLAGIGAGLYPVELEKQRALLMPDLQILDPFLKTSYAPNQLLNTGVELGVPALIALACVFLLAGWAAFSRREPRATDWAVSLLGLAGALQLGPALYNSEAIVFCWWIVGLAAVSSRTGGRPDTDPVDSAGALRRTLLRRAAAVWTIAVLVLGVAGQLLAWPRLAVENQWQQLRWRMNIGMQPAQPDGQWTASQATFSVDEAATSLLVRWHAGDEAATAYRAVVSFFVDGRLVERSFALPGRIRESVLPLPAVKGFKRISVWVVPPFVPADAVGGTDRRSLGIFIHSVAPRGAAAGPAPRAGRAE